MRKLVWKQESKTDFNTQTELHMKLLHTHSIQAKMDTV